MEIELLDIQNPKWRFTLANLQHDVYHLPEYLSIEAKRIQAKPLALLIQEHDKIFFLPFLLRHCGDLLPEMSLKEDIYDAVSPYGYSGILLSSSAEKEPDFIGRALQELQELFKELHICSLFVRNHPILGNKFADLFPENTLTLSGETVSIDLTIPETLYWQSLRKTHRLRISKCKEIGCQVEFVHPKEAEYMDAFIKIYYETMSRVSAHLMYFFDKSYFDDLIGLGEHVHLGVVKLENQIVCAGIFFESCQIVQFHLSGTKSDFLHLSPATMLNDATRLWVKDRHNQWLHLGGGVGARKDSLYQFKSGFSRQRHTFWTIRMITHLEHYQTLLVYREHLIGQTTTNQFFPAYRTLT